MYQYQHLPFPSLYDRWALDEETTVRLKAWQQRQRDRRANARVP